MSVYNTEEFVRTAIESILGQTFDDFEFVIVNDGSTDRSGELISSYSDSRIRVIHNDRNLGLTRSLNVGLRNARAPLVARQDADDVSHRDRLAAQVAFMESHAEVALLGTQARTIDAQGIPFALSELRKATRPESILWQMAVDSAFVHTSVMFRREIALKSFGGYDESFTNGQDADLWSRIAAEHAVRNLPDFLVDSRVHPESISAKKDFVTPEAISRGESIYRRTLRRVVPPEIVPDEWVSLYVRLYVGRQFSQEEAKRLLYGFQAIGRHFMSTRHETTVSEEFRRVLAAKFLLIAAYFRGSHRFLAALALSNACRYSGRLVSTKLHRQLGRMTRRAFASAQV